MRLSKRFCQDRTIVMNAVQKKYASALVFADKLIALDEELAVAALISLSSHTVGSLIDKHLIDTSLQIADF